MYRAYTLMSFEKSRYDCSHDSFVYLSYLTALSTYAHSLSIGVDPGPLVHLTYLIRTDFPVIVPLNSGTDVSP